MSDSGYRRHVDGAHPLMSEVFGDGVGLTERERLASALARLREHFVYRPVRGRLGFDKLREARAGGSAGPSPANCFDLSSVLVSSLRRVGFSPDAVFVVLCDMLWLGRRARTDFHACVLVLLGDAMLWVDPENLEVVETSGGALLDRYKVHVIFNDRFVYVMEAEKQRLISRNMPHSGLQCFLFGQGEPAVQAVLGEPGFRASIAAYFRDGQISGIEAPLEERAISAGLLARRDDGSLGPGQKLVLTPAHGERAFQAEVAVHIDKYLGITAETLPALRRAYEACSSAARFGWSDVCHAIVAGMFLDLALGAELHIREEVGAKHGSCVVWAFEDISAQNGFGVRWLAPSSSHAGVAQLWHVRVDRPPLRLEPRMVEVLARHALGEPVALGGPEVLYLRYSKLLRGNAITIPVFLPEDTERLLEPLMSGAARLLREATLPALQCIKEISGWGMALEDENHRHAAVRLLLEYATDRVVDAGLLEPFPDSKKAAPAPGWGTWLWIEPSNRPMRLVREGVAATEGAT